MSFIAILLWAACHFVQQYILCLYSRVLVCFFSAGGEAFPKGCPHHLHVQLPDLLCALRHSICGVGNVQRSVKWL